MTQSTPKTMQPPVSFEETFSTSALKQLYSERIAGTRTRGRDGLSALRVSELHLDQMFNYIEEHVLAGSYEFSPFREILRMKGRTKPPRVLSIPSLRDRIVLSSIAAHIVNAAPGVAFPRPQALVSQIRDSINSRNYSDFIRLDIVAFYPSISHSSIMTALEQVGLSPDAIGLVMKAVKTPTLPDGPTTGARPSTPRGVPAGTAIANVLGEVALSNVDDAVRNVADVKYFRYVDDIVILSPRGLRTKLRSLVKSELQEVGLKAHPKSAKNKSSSGRVATEPFEYLGYTFTRGSVTVDQSRHARLVDSLARPVTALRRANEEGHSGIERVRQRSEWWLNFRITGCISGGVRRGWLPYYSQIDDMRLLHHLDAIVRDLLTRLPAAMVVKPKSFVTAYTLTRNPKRDKGAYIPNFDLITDVAEMRALLELASTYRSIPNDAVGVEKLFRRFVGFAVKELETDVGSVS